MTDQTQVAPTPVRLTKATPVEPGTPRSTNEGYAPVGSGTPAADARQTQVATELDAARKAKADARKAKVDAKKAEPTPEEVVFVAKAMDFDSLLDWKRPERCENARVEAKRMIVAHRACLRLGEVAKAPVAEGDAVPLTKAMRGQTATPAQASGTPVSLTKATPRESVGSPTPEQKARADKGEQDRLNVPGNYSPSVARPVEPARVPFVTSTPENPGSYSPSVAQPTPNAPPLTPNSPPNLPPFNAPPLTSEQYAEQRRRLVE
jgi:hypothetical protein